MRIVLNDYGGHAFPLDLAVELSRRGHDVVHAYCHDNSTPHGDFAAAKAKGVSVEPIALGRPFEKYRVVRRAVDEIDYGFRSAYRMVRSRPDVVMLAQLPLLSLLLVLIVSKIRRIKSVLWLQDVQSGLVTAVEGGDGRSFTSKAARWVEGSSARMADEIATISDGFAQKALEFGAKPDRTTVIENWAPIDNFQQFAKQNSWSKDHDLSDRLVFLYSGTLGAKHRPELLLDFAAELAAFDDEARLVVVSEGYGADYLQQAFENDPDAGRNVLLLPFQPFEDLPMVLASADVLLVVLAKEAGEYSVPSKVLSYLACGRPILGHMPRESAVSRLVNERASAGVVVDSDELFVKSAMALAASPSDRKAYGDAGRAWAEEHFAVGEIGDRFEVILARLASGAEPQSTDLHITQGSFAGPDHAAAQGRSK